MSIISAVGVLSTVKLDDEATLAARKVNVISPYRLLPDEFAADELAITKMPPKNGLHVSQRAP